MKIGGLQKTTLIDYPGKIACTIFLSGCNFRCGFCYNSDLVFDKLDSFSKDYILNFLKKRKGKLDGVCITGGEPFLTIGKDFVKKIKNMGYFIKVDTNGSFPEKLKEFIDEGLIDSVAMDIKNSKERYQLSCGVNINLGKLEESIKIISKLRDYEFRTTIVNGLHDSDSIKKIGIWLNSIIGKKPKNYSLQGFKNEGNFIDKKYANVSNTTEEQLKELKKVALEYFEKVQIKV